MIRVFGIAALIALAPTLSVAQDLSDERAFQIAQDRDACGEGGIIADASFRDANTIVVDCAEVGAGFAAGAGAAGAAAAFGGIGGAALAGVSALVVVGAVAAAADDGDSSSGTN